MLHYVILINRTSGILMFEKKLSDKLPDIRSDLLSGMLIALRKFSTELEIGELSTFNTHNQKFLISVTQSTLVALIIDFEDSEKELDKLAIKIGQIFEQNFDVENWKGDLDVFDPFNEILDAILKEFAWKQVGQTKLLINEPFILGFVLYDTKNRLFYDFTPQEYDVIKLIQNAEERKETKIRIDEKDEIYYYTKTDLAGCVIIFESRVPLEKFNRYTKTFTFLIQNLHSPYIFQDNLLQSAKKLFSEEVIDSVRQNNNVPLLQIFTTAQDSLALIENIRRFKVRVLIKFKE